MNNKKLFGSFLGGGVTIAIASFGGIKLKDNLDYRAKVNYYGELSNYFLNHSPDEWKGYYIPKWEDHRRWQKIYQNEKGKILSQSFNNYEKMRDACYEHLSKDKKFENCSLSDSWCNSCAWGKDWN